MVNLCYAIAPDSAYIHSNRQSFWILNTPSFTINMPLKQLTAKYAVKRPKCPQICILFRFALTIQTGSTKADVTVKVCHITMTSVLIFTVENRTHCSYLLLYTACQCWYPHHYTVPRQTLSLLQIHLQTSLPSQTTFTFIWKSMHCLILERCFCWQMFQSYSTDVHWTEPWTWSFCCDSIVV